MQLAVPFHEQEPQHCGAAALAAVLDYFQVTYSMPELKKHLYVPVLAGTTCELITDFAGRQGVAAEACQGELAETDEELSQGRPVVVLWGPVEGSQVGHFVVVTGVHPARDRILLHTGRQANHWVKMTYFQARWDAGGERLIRFEDPVSP